jgi:hypothetical protein
MSKIHLVMQGKGGVGKSLLAFYIAQYVREKSGKCLVFDTDPLNQTLARTASLEAKVVRILADDHITIMKNAFDLMIEECEAEEADVVIDVGASSFVPMLEYCTKNGVYDLWHEMGHTCILHSIITGKDFRDTCKMFGVVMEKTGRLSSVSSVVWLNPFAGAVEQDGMGFEDTVFYRDNMDAIKSVLPMPAFIDDMMHGDFLAMMEEGKTFDEIISDLAVPLMRRQRTRMMKKRVMDVLDRAGIF